MQFADFQPEQMLDLGEHTITEEEIVEFARRYDPQPFHLEKHLAERSRWLGLIASGFHTCSIALRIVVERVLLGSESIGSPGLEYVRWPNPVRAGDRLRMHAKVLDSSISKSGRIGVLRWQWLMFNQQDQPVLDLAVTSLFALEVDIAGAHDL